MKSTQSFVLIIVIPIVIAITSCSKKYQVFETSSINTKIEKDLYVFENSEIKIIYNFWSAGGQVSFYVTNKTDSAIYVDWNKSHFIYNGISYEYWYDLEETNSFYSSTSINSYSSFGNALANIFGAMTYGKKLSLVASSKSKPKKIIQIPPNSSIIVSKFSISNVPFFNCDFNLKNTRRKTPNTKAFETFNSPLNFRNYLTYSFKETSQSDIIIDNEFYISSISFMNEKLFLGKSLSTKVCDIKGTAIYKHDYSFPYKKPNSFYLKLNRK